jgi:hypothetical protein
VKAALLAIASLALVAGACGDNKGNTTTTDAAVSLDAGTDAPMGIDAGIDANTFTTFVKDQIVNHTAGNTEPVPYATFSTLPDPDQTNPAAYNSLFP